MCPLPVSINNFHSFHSLIKPSTISTAHNLKVWQYSRLTFGDLSIDINIRALNPHKISKLLLNLHNEKYESVNNHFVAICCQEIFNVTNN